MNAPPVLLGPISLDPKSEAPLYRQLYDQLRHAILDGRLPTGVRLPSSRTLAKELSVGRNTIVAAFEQLLVEGYLEARTGAGTQVAALLPESLLEVGGGAAKPADNPSPEDLLAGLSDRGRRMMGVQRVPTGYEKGQARAFQHGLPAIEQFPFGVWSRLLARRGRAVQGRHYDYHVAAGYEPLRDALATYLGAARGVVCKPEQIIITTGAQAALDLAARLLVDPGDPVWIEDPGYLGARGAFFGASADLVPVPIDREGLQIDVGLKRAPAPKLIYVTPSHQFPTGATMSIKRRLALLETAKQTGAWILEDDYDSEYRYVGRPLPALQGLDHAGRTIYMGTLAKVLFPAVRIGYLVVPEALIEPFTIAIRLTGQIAPAFLQAALADFITEGHFGTHIRKMRTLYAARRQLLIDALEKYGQGRLTMPETEAGMQLAAHLPDGIDDIELAKAAARHKVHTTPLSTYYLGGPSTKDRNALYLGYAAVADTEIPRAAQRLVAALDELS